MHFSTQASRRAFLQTVGAMSSGMALPALAQASQTFPRGPVRIILPLPAGGVADGSTRPLANELERLWKQPVVVDNRPGGLFMIGMQTLLQAPADGHTLIYMYNSMASVQAVHKKFDLTRQLIPVTQVSSVPMVLLVPGKSPFRTLAELIAHGRKNPGKLNYCTLGQGSVEHLKSVQLEQAANFSATSVPYKSGPEMITGLIAGDIDFSLTAGSFARVYAPKGQVRVLAVIDKQHWSDMPEVPTIGEAGLDVPPLTLWNGFGVKAGTSPAVVQSLFRDLQIAAVAPQVKEALAQQSFTPVLSPSMADFQSFVKADIAWMAKMATELHIEPER